MRRQAGYLGTQIPGATVAAVPDAGHASNLDNPDFVTRVVRELLETVSQTEAVEATERD